MKLMRAQQSDILKNEAIFIYNLIFSSYPSPHIYLQWIYAKPIYR